MNQLAEPAPDLVEAVLIDMADLVCWMFVDVPDSTLAATGRHQP